jgi:hypothetical protein
MNILKWLIRIIFWLQAFAAPIILFGLIGIWIGSLDAIIVLLIAGTVTGIILAEYIRRKIGLEIFFARI